ncbi:MAG: WXG100 family type VII secretion target [Chloroflexales bacterium]|nr:WXG100 family type VII secretion target [Chloroflexales bacterium]
MSTDVIQANYDHLDAVAARFGQHAELVVALDSRMRQGVQALADGGWEGAGSAAFLAEMQGEVFPALQRFQYALEEARAVTLEAKIILQQAEEEAASVFQGDGTGMRSAAAGAEAQGVLDHVGDFFGGMYAEGKDMVTGVWNMVTNPIDTAKGVWHAVTHPEEFWEAFKQPYVEDWESGHPWRAIGRGVMFVGSALIGTKGVDKVGKASNMSRVARVAGETVDDAGRIARTSSGEVSLASGVAKGVSAERGLLNTYGDALWEILGPGRVSHADEWTSTLSRAREMGVEVVDRPGTLAYEPMFGAPGRLLLDPDASIGALRHEFRHVLDDADLGHPGFRIMADSEAFWRLEYRGYMEEIRLAREIRAYDAARNILQEMRARRREILGE